MTVVTDSDAALYLTDVHHFFEAPALDPFKGDSISESGIDQLMDTMKARPRGAPKLQRIVLHLPPEDITPDLTARLKTAITTYCNVQKRLSRQRVRETRIEGQRALRIGFIAWAVCLLLSTLSEKLFSTYSMQGRLFGEGFLIAGWVSLWRPAELLLYDWWPFAREVKLYERIKAMDLAIVPRALESGPPPLPD
ncbi:hypothetical protein SAMN02745157_3029 [Kaistia soli DSM 19436]|uniref:Uncharacterized protein n=1 Tax=Kaistia soli DSM 19436 TaxID=1122133 RepID=A0A1M5FG53_9HYPH|nr:hypothetical protein [Kaistia soli]SHF90142.1 hypothetical protein SAMN02745157_3029 [Kaistia soli DSM 19436]